MSARITAADVQVLLNRRELGQVSAKVTSRGRVYVVDLNPMWSNDWMCSCGHGPPITPPGKRDMPECAHIRATKEAIGE